MPPYLVSHILYLHFQLSTLKQKAGPFQAPTWLAYHRWLCLVKGFSVHYPQFLHIIQSAIVYFIQFSVLQNPNPRAMIQPERELPKQTVQTFQAHKNRRQQIDDKEFEVVRREHQKKIPEKAERTSGTIKKSSEVSNGKQKPKHSDPSEDQKKEHRKSCRKKMRKKLSQKAPDNPKKNTHSRFSRTRTFKHNIY